MRPTVSVIIPAYNERARIGQTLRAVFSLEAGLEVIVVDDGSTDRTAELAAARGARVIRMGRRVGKGGAVAAGAAAASAPLLLFLDADLGASAREAHLLLAPVRSGLADMTVARFAAGSAGGFGLARRLAAWGIARAAGCRVYAPLSGQRALRREVLDALPGGLASGWALEVALTIDAARLGFRVMEVDTAMGHKATGRNVAGFWHRGRQFLAVARALSRRAPT